MKAYTETERQEHLENWERGNLSKAAYAKLAGIYPTTFYTWTRGVGKTGEKFVEINRHLIPKTREDIVIEKGTLTIRIPLSSGVNELKKILSALKEVI
jgi:hypothetical protein